MSFTREHKPNMIQFFTTREHYTQSFSTYELQIEQSWRKWRVLGFTLMFAAPELVWTGRKTNCIIQATREIHPGGLEFGPILKPPRAKMCATHLWDKLYPYVYMVVLLCKSDTMPQLSSFYRLFYFLLFQTFGHFVKKGTQALKVTSFPRAFLNHKKSHWH